MHFRYVLIFISILLVSACDFNVNFKESVPAKPTSFELFGCPIHMLTTTIGDLGKGQKEIWLQMDYQKESCSIAKKMPPASTYALVQARFDCTNRKVAVKKYMLMGTGNKVLGEVTDLVEFEKFREQTLAEYIYNQHLCQ